MLMVHSNIIEVSFIPSKPEVPCNKGRNEIGNMASRASEPQIEDFLDRNISIKIVIIKDVLKMNPSLCNNGTQNKNVVHFLHVIITLAFISQNRTSFK